MEHQAAPTPSGSKEASGTSGTKESYQKGLSRLAVIGVAVAVVLAMVSGVVLWTAARESRRPATITTAALAVSSGKTWETKAGSTSKISGGTRTEMSSSAVPTGAASEAHTSSRAPAVCNTEDCQYMRRLLDTAVDKTKDPCQNFYTFVCNGVDESERTDSGMLTSASTNFAVSILGDLTAKNVTTGRQSASEKAAAMFRHCQRVSHDPGNQVAILAFLEEYGLIKEGNRTFDPVDTLIQFIFKIDIPVLFSLKVMYLDQTPPYPFELGVRNEFVLRKTNRSSSLHVEEDLVSSILVTAGLWHSTSDVDKALVRTILTTEEKIINASDVDHVEDMHTTLLSHLGYLQNDTALGAKWAQSLEQHMDKRFRRGNRVYYHNWVSTFFQSILGSDSNISNSDMQRYFLWATATFFVNAAHMQESSSDVITPCIEDVTSLFRFAAASSVLFAKVNQTRVDSAKAMTDRIIDEIKSSFNQCSWMDDVTRKGALDKISLLHRYEGYPLNLTTPGAVDAYYKDYPDVTGPYVADIIAVGRISTVQHLEHLLTTSQEFIRAYSAAAAVEPYEFSAAYSGPCNFIVIPATAMLRPVFIYGGPAEFNYGALGRVVTHELMHAFDEGNHFLDGFGRNASWWSNESDAAYNERIRCHNVTIETAPKARRLQDYPDEYLADTMGSQSLLRAYKKASAESTLTLGDVKGLTRDQLFYVSWCFLWCGNIVPDDTHPPLDERCNVPLRNDAHFSEAFSCPEDSPMNPKQKCNFW